MTRKERRALARGAKASLEIVPLAQAFGTPAAQLAADLAKVDYASPARAGLAVVSRSYDEHGELVSGS
jgi:hypothetical protein